MSHLCNKCGCLLDQHNWADWAKRTGHYICKSCYSLIRKAYKISRGMKETLYFHDYYKSHKTELKARRSKLLEKRKQWNKNYYQKNKEKSSAKALANRLTPLAESCSICHTENNLERHHSDYSKPLEVITLCHACHFEIHSGLKILEE